MRKGERTRQRLLESATTAFAANAYDRVTVNQVAEMAGLTAAAIYKYFPDKESMYLAASNHAVDRTTRRILAAVDAASGDKARLRAFVATLAEVIVDDEENTTLFERHLIAGETEVLKDNVRIAFDEPFAILQGLLAAVSPDRATREDTAAIFGMTLGLVQFSNMLELSDRHRIGLHRDSASLAQFVLQRLVPKVLEPTGRSPR